MKTATTIPKKRLTKKQLRVKKAIARLTDYMVTYDKQICYLDYDDETIIADVVYGLGIALDDKQYSMSDGFKRFKAVLKKYLEDHP